MSDPHRQPPDPQMPPQPKAKATERDRPFAFMVSVGLLLGALTLQWSNITQDQQQSADDKLFAGNACKDSYPPPWRTRNVGLSPELMPSLQGFGIQGCASMEFRPSTCNEEHFLVRCYEEEQRKGLFKVYRIELESGDVFSMYPDMT